jgi:hypothetical protein
MAAFSAFRVRERFNPAVSDMFVTGVSLLHLAVAGKYETVSNAELIHRKAVAG